MKIISASHVRELDRIAIRKGIKGEVLMERASLGIARILDFFQSLRKGKILFVCGRGNNGGDGMLASSILKKKGIDVEVYLIGGKELKGESLWAYNIAKKRNVKFLSKSEFLKKLNEAVYIFDSIFGTGFKGEIKGEAKNIIKKINESNKIIISCDTPSGINGDTGIGTGVSVKADFTITIGYPKTGLFKEEGYFNSGTVFFIDIGLKRIKGSFFSMSVSEEIKKNISIFPVDTHKYKKGHTLVIAGNKGMVGAGILSVKGALRSGCGIVSLSSNDDVLKAVNYYEPQVLTVKTEDIFYFIKQKKVNSVVFGPGLGRDNFYTEILRKILSFGIPVVIDADGIFHYEKLKKDFRNFKNKVLTPHEGEIKFLTKAKKDRLNVLKNLIRDNKGVFVLKGYKTLIGEKERDIFINPAGGNLLAQAGSGDLLAGLIGGFISQGISLFESAKTGCFLHGLAGDFAKIKYGRMGIKLEEIEKLIPVCMRSIYEGFV